MGAVVRGYAVVQGSCSQSCRQRSADLLLPFPSPDLSLVLDVRSGCLGGAIPRVVVVSSPLSRSLRCGLRCRLQG